jgi:CheY-like chemotaxis protein
MSYFEIIERLQGYLVSKSADVEPLTDGDKSFKERLPVLRAVIPQRSVILLVDDDPDQVAIFKRALTAAGYTVVTANSALEALEVAKQRDFHVLVLDFMMPDINGLDLISQIRGSDEGGRNKETPAILLTSSDQDVELLAVQQEADMFCEKFRAQVLLPKQIQFLLET